MKPAKVFGSRHPSRKVQRAALQAILIQRDSLDGLDLAHLARSYHMTIESVAGMVVDERQRRNLAGLGPFGWTDDGNGQ